jgi:hypothetical protein
MSLSSAIDAYNESTSHQIVLKPTRDGRVTAVLPLTGREVLVQGNITHTLAVSADDVAAVVREARAAMAPALALLDAALAEPVGAAEA